jgi:hypothetical protein
MVDISAKQTFRVEISERFSLYEPLMTSFFSIVFFPRGITCFLIKMDTDY